MEQDPKTKHPTPGELPLALGPYHIEARIGTGGMGAVFRAHDERLDRHVAIKRILAKDGEQHPAIIRRFLREARLAARLSHPAIVQIHDLLSVEGQAWIVMELLAGPSLAKLVHSGPLPFHRVLDIGHDVALGLAHAHSHSTIHRDLKVENVMLTSEGKAKILDFGLAKEVWLEDDGDDGSLTVSGAVVGTCRAMSPEQARGLEVDHRSDLFSLGTLLYEMSTGSRPFEGETALDSLTRVCTHQPASLDLVLTYAPSRFVRLVDALLRKDPVMRPQSAQEVAEILAAISRRGTEPVTGSNADPPPASSDRSAHDLSEPDDAAVLESSTIVELDPTDLVSGASAKRPYLQRWIVALVVSAIALLLTTDRPPTGGGREADWTDHHRI